MIDAYFNEEVEYRDYSYHDYYYFARGDGSGYGSGHGHGIGQGWGGGRGLFNNVSNNFQSVGEINE